MKSSVRAALAGLCLFALAQAGCGFGPSSGPTHVFVVEPAPAFLTEELAIEKAREYLAKEGDEPEEWPLYRTDAPKRLALLTAPRTGSSTGSGRGRGGYFGRDRQLRAVDVRLEGNQVTCSMFYGL